MFYTGLTFHKNTNMKNVTLPLACFLACSFYAGAQTITSSWAPAPYKANEIHYTENVSGVEAGAAGSGQNWDFSSLTDDSVNVESIVPTTGLPFASEFTEATHASVVSDPEGTFVSYFKTTSSAYTILGAGFEGGGISGTFIYSNPIDLFRFPIGFGQAYNDDFESTITALGFSYDRNGAVQVDVDGSGTLTTPIGTFSNVLRVKSVETYNLLGLPPIPGASTSGVVTTYNYISADHPGSILLSYIINDDNIGNVDTTIGFADPNFQSIEQISKNEFNLFPVPAADKINITSNSGILNVELFDISGRRSTQIAYNGVSKAVIDVALLPSGVYVARVQLVNGTVMNRRVIVSH